MKERHPIIGDVRSRCLIGCVELVRDRNAKEPIVEFNTAPPLVDEIKAQLIERGLYVYVRWNLILLAPPLIIVEQDLRKGLALLEEVIGWVAKRLYTAPGRK